MRTARQQRIPLSIATVVTILICTALINNTAQEAQTLEEGVDRRDLAALKQAGNENRKDLIPGLEQAAEASADPDAPTRIWAKAALAKSGVKKYLDETVTELTATNSLLFGYHERWYRMSVWDV